MPCFILGGRMDITKALLNMALGGSAWVLWLLIGLSVASVAIMIDKALTFYRFRFNPDRFVAEIEPATIKGLGLVKDDRQRNDAQHQ